MKPLLLITIFYCGCIFSMAQPCLIYPFGMLDIDPSVMRSNHIKAFEVEYDFYVVMTNGKGGKRKNRRLSKEVTQVKYLVNDSGFVYAEQYGKEKDSMIWITHQPLPWDPDQWISTADSMVVDSPFIYLYNASREDKTKRLTQQYNWNGNIVYNTLFMGNPAKRLSETRYYYTQGRLDSMVVNPEGWYKTVYVFVYDPYHEQTDQVLEFRMFRREDAYDPPELYSITYFTYEGPYDLSGKRLLREVRVITPTDASIHWVVAKIQWITK